MSVSKSRRAFLQQSTWAGLGLALAPQAWAARPAAGFGLGIDVLAESGFASLRGQRVGLLTNQAGVNRHGRSSVDILYRARPVNLVALFGPEHGIDGKAKANVPVLNARHPGTGLPVFSLYGKYRRPTKAMLDLLDTMVVDLQDLGVRSYTYVSCMRYVIEECFAAGKRVVVLDRPNPLGGRKIDGPPLESEWESYVGAFPVPYVHGMTIGELATMAKKQPGVLKTSDRVRERGQLEVIKMKGWTRDTMWPATGLRWIPTSPAIPDLSAAMGYAMTGLGTQLGRFSHGYGSLYPFRLLQYPGKSPEDIQRALEARRLPGYQFTVTRFEERGQPRRGLYVGVSDWDAMRPIEISLHMMALTCRWEPNPFRRAKESERTLWLKHVGTTALWDALVRDGMRLDIPRFLRLWERRNDAFANLRRRWLLY